MVFKRKLKYLEKKKVKIDQLGFQIKEANRRANQVERRKYSR